jgi:hypothetical protein
MNELNIDLIENNVDIYFIRHAESCSNISSMFSFGKISHPPLSYLGIQQAINLSINNKIIDIDFDKYYCSPSLRTIMTACLALRKKANTRDLKNPIKLFLNPYLIEKRSIGKYDRQNSIVPNIQLQKMIIYLKLWFKEHYFNNYIDYEFVYIMYDLVRLLNHDNNLTKYKELIKNLLKVKETVSTVLTVETVETVETVKTKKELLKELLKELEKEDYKEPIKKFSIINTENGDDIYIKILSFIDNPILDENEEKNSIIILDYRIIIEQLKTFYDEKIFMNNIIIDYSYNDSYEFKEHNANICKFIVDYIYEFKNCVPKKDYKILCFSHGATLFETFSLETSLKNTEILHYNLKTKNKQRIFNNNIVINKNIEDICGSLYTLYNLKYKMFKVIDNYFKDINYKINTDNTIDNNFKVYNEKEVDEEYRHKYLKYKNKYLNYKKIYIKLNN